MVIILNLVDTDKQFNLRNLVESITVFLFQLRLFITLWY